MALTEARRLEIRGTGYDLVLDMTASTTIYAGALVCINAAGFAVPAAAAANNVAVGIAIQTKKTGSGGSDKIVVRAGVIAKLGHTSVNANKIARADVGNAAYVVDDESVGDAGGAVDIIAGMVVGFDDDGVWVDLNRAPAAVA